MKRKGQPNIINSKAVRPWHEVARLYNEKNGTSITSNGCRATHTFAIRKMRGEFLKLVPTALLTEEE